MTTSNSQNDEKRRKLEKPAIDAKEALAFLNEKYPNLGPIDSIKPLESYDDRNFNIENKTTNTKYTLKFHNGVESDNKVFIQAQNQTLIFLHEKGFECPYPVKSNEGNFIESISLSLPGCEDDGSRGGKRDFAVRVLSWVSGSPMCSVEADASMIENTGRYLGEVRNALDKGDQGCFDAPGAHRNHLWDLCQMQFIEPYIASVQTSDQKQLIQKALKQYLEIVQPQLQNLRKGILQNDYNDANIIVDAEGKVAGVIDFGDMIYSCVVNEVAIGMAYSMLSSFGKKDKMMEAACAFLKGFCSVYPLQMKEVLLLNHLICGRLATSATLGAYTYEQNPDEYILLHAKPCWRALEFLLSQSDEEISKKYVATASSVSTILE